MRLIIMALALSAMTLFACPGNCGKGQMQGKICDMPMDGKQGKCGSKKMERPGSTLGTVKYALEKMGLRDNGDIKVAIHEYKKTVRGLKRGMNTDAFKEGRFDPEVYRQNSRKTTKLQAEVDLFETIYLVLTDEQKKQFHILMAGHQHFMGLENVGPDGTCMSKQACAGCGCDGKGTPGCQCKGSDGGICQCDNCKMDKQACKSMAKTCDSCGCQGKGTPGCQCKGSDGGICKCDNCKMDKPACKGGMKGGMKCGPGKCGGGS